MKYRISLILPCRNEEQALKSLMPQIPKWIDEVIVVDNGSTDKTVEVAQSLGARVLVESRHCQGIGYGYALATGIKEARGDIIVCMDGDGSYPVKSIFKIVRELDSKKLDFISCNRLPMRRPRKMSYVRVMGVKILNMFVFTLFGYSIKDSLTGMWVFRKSVLNYLNLFEGGWNFSLEIKLNAILNDHIVFGECDIPYHDREFNQSKQNLFNTGFTHLLFLFEKRLRKTDGIAVATNSGVSLLET